jgi:uroporphyrinogen-III synthase
MKGLSLNHHIWVIRSPWTADRSVSMWQARGYRTAAFDLLNLLPDAGHIEACRRYCYECSDWLLWTSPSCVELVFSTNQPQSSLSKSQHFAIGTATQQALLKYGIASRVADAHQSGWDACLPEILRLTSKGAVVAGEGGRTQKILQHFLPPCQIFTLYRRVYQPIDWERFWQPKPIAVLPGSSEIVEKIFDQASAEDRFTLQSIPYISNHPRIYSMLKSQGVHNIYDDF